MEHNFCGSTSTKPAEPEQPTSLSCCIFALLHGWNLWRSRRGDHTRVSRASNHRNRYRFVLRLLLMAAVSERLSCRTHTALGTTPHREPQDALETTCFSPLTTRCGATKSFVQGVLNGVVADAKGLKDGKMPTQMTIIVMTGAALLLMLVVAVRTPTKSRPKKD